MPELPEIDCACASVRRTARLITQLYSQEMGPGIEPGQFSLLMALDKFPNASQTGLGRALGFDKTTLSRNLQVMKRNGWIAPADLGGYHLTEAGEQQLKQTRPAWKRAQRKLRAALKGQAWESMLAVFHNAALAASAK